MSDDRFDLTIVLSDYGQLPPRNVARVGWFGLSRDKALHLFGSLRLFGWHDRDDMTHEFREQHMPKKPTSRYRLFRLKASDTDTMTEAFNREIRRGELAVHFTVLADGDLLVLVDGFNIRTGTHDE